MTVYIIPRSPGEWAMTAAAYRKPDLTWVGLRDYTVSHRLSHLLCPLAWGSCCSCPGSVVFGEQASSSFSCCTSSAKCCSKSLFWSSSWWTRAWASIRAAVSAAIWSFNSCTCSGSKEQGVFVCQQVWFNIIAKPRCNRLLWLVIFSCLTTTHQDWNWK